MAGRKQDGWTLRQDGQTGAERKAISASLPEFLPDTSPPVTLGKGEQCRMEMLNWDGVIGKRCCSSGCVGGCSWERGTSGKACVQAPSALLLGPSNLQFVLSSSLGTDWDRSGRAG